VEQDANAASETGPGRQKRPPTTVPKWIGVSLLVVAPLVVGALLNLFHNAGEIYEYWAGTPTTATIDHCLPGRPGTCYARWSVGGVSQTGPINRTFGPVGSQLDVRVQGGTAYPTSEASPDYPSMFISFFGIVVLCVLWIVWRKHVTGSWPWSGKRTKDQTGL
jgi:hypothetical protein